MAQTFKPYQSVGQGLNPLKLPQGYALQESKNTMNVLSQGLNRMSDFAFKQASVFAQIEGEKWGVENAPTLKDIKQANKLGEDPFSMFDSSLFGRTARASALKVLENEIIVAGTKTMNDLVYNAEQNSLHPNDLNDGLNAHIMGLIEPIAVNSPALASKLKAQLLLKGASEFDAYRKAHAKSTASTLSAKDRDATNTWIDDLSHGIFNTLYDQQLFNDEFIKVQKNTLLEKLKDPASDYSKAEIESKLADFEKEVIGFAKGKVYDHVLSQPKGKQSELLNKILEGKPTGNNLLDKALKIRSMDFNAREKIVGELRIHMRELRENENFEEEQAEENRVEKEEEALIMFNKSSVGEIDYQQADSAIRLMDKWNPVKAMELRETLNKGKGAKRLVTNYKDPTVRNFIDQAQKGTITYAMLEEIRDQLSDEDWTKYDKQIDLRKNAEMKIALGAIKIATEFNPDGILVEDTKENEIRSLKYVELLGELETTVLNATRNNIDINISEVVKNLTQGVKEELKLEVTKIETDNLKAEINNNYKPFFRNWLEDPPEELQDQAKAILTELKRVQRKIEDERLTGSKAKDLVKRITPALTVNRLPVAISSLETLLEKLE